MKKGVVYMHKFIYVHLRDWYYQQDGDDDFRARWQRIVLFTVTLVMPILAISLVAVEGDMERILPFDEFDMALRKIFLIPVGLLLFGISWLVFRLSGVRNLSVQYRSIHIGDYPRRLRIVVIAAIVLLWFSPIWVGLGYIALTD